MVVVPRGKVLPEAGPAVRVMVAPEQLSVTVGAFQVATAPHEASAFRLILIGQAAITGGVASTTVTVKEHWSVSPLSSVTKKFTVVTPTG